MSDSLLIIEDEVMLGAELERRYRRAGWEVHRALDVSSARRQLVDDALAPLVVLSDMSLPDGNALDLLDTMRSQGATGEWVFLTGYGSISDSVRGLRIGAYDFLEKPCDPARLDLVLAGAARSARAHRRLQEQGASEHRRYSPAAFIGRSAAGQRVRALLDRFATVPLSTLLLAGETGTGKGLVARIVHYSGQRRNGPIVEVNCAALPRDLLESELFGHEAGSFTGARGRRRGLMEQADGGTLFLDEIGEMPLDLQSKLLKAIEDRTFRRVGGTDEVRTDVQIVASSNRNLRERAERGEFREDLYHRLSVFVLELPALRTRREDIDDLLPVLIAEFNARAGTSVRHVPGELRRQLLAYDWPGNVRELRNTIERCVLLSSGDTLDAQWLNLGGAVPSAPSMADPPPLVCLPLDGSMSLEEMDREIIRIALERASGNTTAAARLLNTTRQTLRYRIDKHGLRTTDE